MTLLFLLSSALANPSVSLGAGVAQSTQLPIVGLDTSWHARSKGVSLYGRLAPTWGTQWTYSELPSGRQQLTGLRADGPLIVRHALGLTGVVELPQQSMDIRLGLEGGGEFLGGADAAPIGPGSWGWTPRALLVGEFVRNDISDTAVGVRMGVGSTAQPICDPNLSLECVRWKPGFVGGVYVYAWLARRVQIEAEIGSTSWITIGYRFGREREAARDPVEAEGHRLAHERWW